MTCCVCQILLEVNWAWSSQAQGWPWVWLSLGSLGISKPTGEQTRPRTEKGEKEKKKKILHLCCNNMFKSVFCFQEKCVKKRPHSVFKGPTRRSDVRTQGNPSLRMSISRCVSYYYLHKDTLIIVFHLVWKGVRAILQPIKLAVVNLCDHLGALEQAAQPWCIITVNVLLENCLFYTFSRRANNVSVFNLVLGRYSACCKK